MTPDDVYALVDDRTSRTFYLLLIVAGLVVVQLIDNLRTRRKVADLLRRSSLLAKVAELNGKLTDQSNSRAESLVAQAQEVAAKVAPLATRVDTAKAETAKVLDAIGTVPKDTVDELIRRSEGAADGPHVEVKL